MKMEEKITAMWQEVGRYFDVLQADKRARQRARLERLRREGRHDSNLARLLARKLSRQAD